MRVVVALGGNALLRRGEPMTAANQRANVLAACVALAPLARDHELVISHGNGPQVGLLALQGSAYKEVEPYPLDVLGAQTEGMIGYLIQQELGNQLPPDQHIASLLTLIEVDPDDPAFGEPTKPIGPIYNETEASCTRAGQGLDLQARRRQLPTGRAVAGATADLRNRSRRVAARTSLRRDLCRRRRDPRHVLRPSSTGRSSNGRGGSSHRQGPGKCDAGGRPRRRRPPDRHRCRRRLHRLGHAPTARHQARKPRRPSPSGSSQRDPWGPRFAPHAPSSRTPAAWRLSVRSLKHCPC